MLFDLLLQPSFPTCATFRRRNRTQRKRFSAHLPLLLAGCSLSHKKLEHTDTRLNISIFAAATQTNTQQRSNSNRQTTLTRQICTLKSNSLITDDPVILICKLESRWQIRERYFSDPNYFPDPHTEKELDIELKLN